MPSEKYVLVGLFLFTLIAILDIRKHLKPAQLSVRDECSEQDHSRSSEYTYLKIRARRDRRGPRSSISVRCVACC